MNKDIFEKIKSAFESNPQASHLFATSDGQCFFSGSSASNHDKDLVKAGGEPGVKKVFRDQLKDIEASFEELPAVPAGDASTGENEGNKPPVEKPLEKMNKAELQAKATELGIAFVEDDTKATLIELINNSKI